MDFDISEPVDFLNFGNLTIADNDVFFEEDIPVKKTKLKGPKYDKQTTEFYRVTRERKLDPIMQTQLDPEFAFAFPYKWDPYTGERQGLDPDGPFYFDPDTLIKYFHTQRLKKLWVYSADEQAGYYEAYYDDAVGIGEDFYFKGRNEHHPEWDVFRLPIIDCYLTKDHNHQFITLGPKLTDDEIKEIDRLANLRPMNYQQQFCAYRPSLAEIKRCYDIAIAQRPNIGNTSGLTHDQIQEQYCLTNRSAVDKLVKIKG